MQPALGRGVPQDYVPLILAVHKHRQGVVMRDTTAESRLHRALKLFKVDQCSTLRFYHRLAAHMIGVSVAQ